MRSRRPLLLLELEQLSRHQARLQLLGDAVGARVGPARGEALQQHAALVAGLALVLGRDQPAAAEAETAEGVMTSAACNGRGGLAGAEAAGRVR